MINKTTTEKNKKPTIISLQSLRAIAFVFIFLSHCDVYDLGGFGVSIFIILSGFLMYYNYCDEELRIDFKNLLYFSLNKIKKLYNLHILTMLACIIIDYISGEIFKHKISLLVVKIICNIFLVQNWVPSETIYFSLNGVAWYLSLSAFLYFIFPIVLRFFKKYINNVSNAIILAIATYTIQVIAAYFSRDVSFDIVYFNKFYKWFTYAFPVFRSGEFVIGCCLAYLFKERDNKNQKTLITVFEIMTVIFTIAISIIYTKGIGILSSKWIKYSLLFAPVSSTIVYLFACKGGYITSTLTNRYLIFVGNISAYAFLMHQLIIRYYDYFIYEGSIFKTQYLRVPMLLVITIIFSYLYHCIFKRLKTHRKDLTNSD